MQRKIDKTQIQNQILYPEGQEVSLRVCNESLPVSVLYAAIILVSPPIMIYSFCLKLCLQAGFMQTYFSMQTIMSASIRKAGQLYLLGYFRGDNIFNSPAYVTSVLAFGKQNLFGCFFS